MVDSETERFINLVRERKAIYDATQQDHQNPLAIDKLWEGIATDAKLPASECRAKWASLKGSYVKYLLTGGRKLRRKMCLMDSLDFLYSHVNQRGEEGSISKKDEFSDDDQNKIVVQRTNCHSIDETTIPIMNFILKNLKAREPESQDSQDMIFFKSILPDVERLSLKRRRRFKEIVLTTLNNFLCEEEIASAIPSSQVVEVQVAKV